MRARRAAAIATAGLAAVAVVGASAAAGAAAGTAATNIITPVPVTLVFDGPSDAGFESLALKGAEAARRSGTATYRVARPSTEGPDPALLDQAVADGSKLVIAVGYQWADYVVAAAKRHPGTDFAIVDGSASTAGSPDLPNVRGILFREDQAGRLAGYLAALTARADGKAPVLGAVGGMRIPPVQRYIAGFRAGARDAAAKSTVIVHYSGSFLQGVGCGRIARRMVNDGAFTVFSVAGACGDEAMRASGAAGRTAIGVDLDQSSMGRYVLTSAVKRLDVAVKDTIADRAAGRFTAGDVRYGLRSSGVGLGRISPDVPADVRAKVARYTRRVATAPGG